MISLEVQSTHWPKGSTRMEGLADFAASVQKENRFLSMDVQQGYHHLRLHPCMRKWFVFRYQGRYYTCVALPFGWGRSCIWFCGLMAYLVRHLRRMGLWVLPYVDDLRIAPSPHGTWATLSHCLRESVRIDEVLRKLGVRRRRDKGVWREGGKRLEHLGVVVDSVLKRFEVTPFKADRVKKGAESLMRQVRQGRRYVVADSVRSFCGLCASFTLAMPWCCFYTRALFDSLMSGKRDARGRVRLNHQAISDLRFWADLARSDVAH